jgi:uncharacterized caspase-like protein
MRGTAWRVAATACIVAGFNLSGCSLDTQYDKYAIVYGVADYEGTLNDLIYPYDDAIAMEAMLTAQGYQVILRVDAAATRANLETLDVPAVALQAEENDLFVFYYSGHGGQPAIGAEGDGSDLLDEYIFLHGSVSPLTLSAAYSDDQLVDAFAPIAARKKVIILDSCNSGGFIGNALEADGEPSALAEGSEGIVALAARAMRLYANFDDSSADIQPWEALVLSASGEREVSWESSSYGHGVFTYYLLESEREGDRNGDGWVTVTEAYDHAQYGLYRDWNIQGLYYAFAPHVSGGPVDYVLFEAR